MKKINSNGYGLQVLGVIFLFLFALPLFFWVLNHFLHLPALILLLKISAAAGAILALLFLILLLIEAKQDERLNRFYAKENKDKRD